MSLYCAHFRSDSSSISQGRHFPLFPTCGLRTKLDGMWALLRIVLLVANAVFFAWASYIIVTTKGTVRPIEYAFGYGIVTCLALNFAYLLIR